MSVKRSVVFFARVLKFQNIMNSRTLNHRNHTVQNKLQPKKFKASNPLLEDLLENNHIRTIYNIAWIVVVTCKLRCLLYNYFTYDRYSLNLDNFQISFSKPLPLLYIWVCMFLASFLPYLGFLLWATIRHKISKLSVPFFDRISLIIFISFIPSYTYFFMVPIIHNDFKPASAVALILELVRFKMKVYAFVRSNVPRALKFTYHDKNETLYPHISKYVYFLFAPTLIYQDEYPRAKSIRWKKVAEHLVNFAGTLLLIDIILEHLLPQFEMNSQNFNSWKNFSVMVIEFIPASIVSIFTIFYLFFHCWLNAFAEMLRFSDRSFYKDFWTSTSFERYFRTWNKVVYDWLYLYIYKDSYEVVWPNNKFFARAMVFFVSAFYHDFILGFTFNLFLPYLWIIYFSVGLIVKLISYNNALGNCLCLLGPAINFSVFLCRCGTHYYYEKI